MYNRVFVNRILNMKKIKYIGLDMDHTLIRYHTKAFEGLVYEMVVDRLINDFNYPKAIKAFQFDFHASIRGLVIDSLNGNILKLSRYGAIRLSHHGTRLIEYRDQKKIYRSTYVDLKDTNYKVIDTAFSVAFCVLYGQLVDYKDENPKLIPSYDQIAEDVNKAVDVIHADGSLKEKVAKDLSRYVKKDKALVKGLKRFISHGKKLFIVTNSDYFYSKLLLDYAINPYLTKGQTWQDLFTYVITLAAKPKFFYEKSRFLKINPADGSMTNVNGKLEPGIYQGGHAQKFSDDLNLTGEHILYVGDHIYGDILRLKKDCNWRTALVVEELGEEIAAQIKSLPLEKNIVTAMQRKIKLEMEHVALLTKSIEEDTKRYQQDIDNLATELMDIDIEVSDLVKKQQKNFNCAWDRVFRAGAEESYFAYQVNRYACIYMEKLTDLLDCSPMTFFRAERRLLAHDFAVEPEND